MGGRADEGVCKFFFEVIFSQNQRDGLVFYPPLFQAVLRIPRQCIRFPILASWSVIDFKVDSCQFLCPPRLLSIEHLGCCKVF